MLFTGMETIKAEYKALNPDGHWFDPSTMRFFKSRLPSRGYAKGDDYYFITSESDFSGVNRFYSVRKLCRNTGEIETIGEFNSMTRNEARKLLASILEVPVSKL